MRKVELLAPAGSFDSLKAAVAAGADAVYIGGTKFGARAYADNPDQDQLKRAIDYVHLYGVNIYLTVNTLLKETEMAELYDYIYPLYCHGLDAVIVQDFGVLNFVKQQFPGMDIHASTQMTITGYHGARVLKEMGASRIVTARELSLKEIARIRREADIEIESFVHGALCYGYSGQCLMSSLIGGRSGNRGRCAQPCRLAYDVKRDGQTINSADERYVLSLKDLYTLEILPDIIEAGVFSLKIEGRMKSPRYTAGVTAVYRKYLDYYLQHGRAGYQVKEQDKQMLADLFDRGGMSAGYYQRHSDRSMVVLKEKPQFRKGNKELFAHLDQVYLDSEPQLGVAAKVILEENKPAQLTLRCGEDMVRVFGAVVQEALKRPLESGQVIKQIGKTGASRFCLSQVDVELRGSVFLPVSALNELRRSGLDKLEDTLLGRHRRVINALPAIGIKPQSSSRPAGEASELVAAVEQQQQLEPVILHYGISQVYIDSIGFPAESWKAAAALCHKQQERKKCLLVFPHIFRKKAEDYFKKNLTLFKQAGFDGVVVRNLESVDFLKNNYPDLPMIFDHTLYVFNEQAKALLTEQGAKRTTLPLELNFGELSKIGGEDMEMVVYGYLPMMVSASCIGKTVTGCSRQEELIYLKDRKGKVMPVKNNCRFCYNTIYNSSPLILLDQKHLLERLNPAVFRLNFTIESEHTVKKVLKDYSQVFLEQQNGIVWKQEFTRGHFKRGIE